MFTVCTETERKRVVVLTSVHCVYRDRERERGWVVLTGVHCTNECSLCVQSAIPRGVSKWKLARHPGGAARRRESLSTRFT